VAGPQTTVISTKAGIWYPFKADFAEALQRCLKSKVLILRLDSRHAGITEFFGVFVVLQIPAPCKLLHHVRP